MAVHSTIIEQSLDVLALTETWHDNSDDVSLRLSTPDSFAVVDTARATGRGGGVFSIRRISIRRIPIIGLGLGLGIAFGELKFGELKRNRGGGVAIVFRKHLRCSRLSLYRRVNADGLEVDQQM